MKKIISLILFVVGICVFAEERVLFDSAAKVDLDGYGYVENFEIVSASGYFGKEQLKIIEPNEKGIRFLVKGVPIDKSVSYKIIPAYPSFINGDSDGNGCLYNVADIKSVKVIATTNRPYDEIILMYSTSPYGEIKEIKFPQDFGAIKSMEEYELVYENPMYENDVRKRDVSNKPILGADADGLYLRGFRIKTNAPSGYSAYSEYSVLYIKKISVEYDKRYTDEQVENAKLLKEEFDIKENEKIIEKAKSKIAERNRARDTQKSLMADSTENNQDTK